jgi:hypothetical protein
MSLKKNARHICFSRLATLTRRLGKCTAHTDISAAGATCCKLAHMHSGPACRFAVQLRCCIHHASACAQMMREVCCCHANAAYVRTQLLLSMPAATLVTCVGRHSPCWCLRSSMTQDLLLTCQRTRHSRRPSPRHVLAIQNAKAILPLLLL